MTKLQKILICIVILFLPELLVFEAKILNYYILEPFFWLIRFGCLLVIALILTYSS